MSYSHPYIDAFGFFYIVYLVSTLRLLVYSLYLGGRDYCPRLQFSFREYVDLAYLNIYYISISSVWIISLVHCIASLFWSFYEFSSFSYVTYTSIGDYDWLLKVWTLLVFKLQFTDVCLPSNLVVPLEDSRMFVCISFMFWSSQSLGICCGLTVWYNFLISLFWWGSFVFPLYVQLWF